MQKQPHQAGQAAVVQMELTRAVLEQVYRVIKVATHQQQGLQISLRQVVVVQVQQGLIYQGVRLQVMVV
jgi:hypothetical protein